MREFEKIILFFHLYNDAVTWSNDHSILKLLTVDKRYDNTGDDDIV